jgi:DNA polymerase-1
MIRVHQRLKESGLDARLVLQVHDELIVECHRDAAEQAREILVREMENAVQLAVPLKVEAATGENWYDTH